jgi:meiotically up-regulated gene 157 (Mug157) protein
MRRYDLVNLPEDCRLVPDCYGMWMTVAEHEVITVKYRDALERIADIMKLPDRMEQNKVYLIAIEALKLENV